jgi:hypothetical protein
MTTVEQSGSVTIALTLAGDVTVSVRLSNVKPTAVDLDVYDVCVAIASLLDYSVASILRTERSLLTV